MIIRALVRGRSVMYQMKTILAGGVLALSLIAHAAAGPREDAASAKARGDYAAAQKDLRPLAESGDARAQYDLGALYSDPSPAQNVPQAAVWYHKAADQGYAPAQAILGGMYAIGGGVSPDATQAAFWFRKAADQNDAEGQTGLATCYARGLGVPQNDT